MRDVTARYAKQYSAKVSKVQSGGRGRREWWAQVVRTVSRPYNLVREPGFTFFALISWPASLKHRDDVEDDELVVNQFTEGMPTTIGGFKDHPLCVSHPFCSSAPYLRPRPVMCWSGTCFETRSSRKTPTNSANSGASLSILEVRCCSSRQRRTGCGMDALFARETNPLNTSSSGRRRLTAGASSKYAQMQKTQMAAVASCRACIRRHRRRDTFLRQSLTYVLRRRVFSPRGN